MTYSGNFDGRAITIIGPASAAMLAAIKPTVGRVSRYGIIPITADQDTAGPMARTVTDAAIVFGALELLLGLMDVGGVAHFAHLGGMVGGYLMIQYWRSGTRRPRF